MMHPEWHEVKASASVMRKIGCLPAIIVYVGMSRGWLCQQPKYV